LIALSINNWNEEHKKKALMITNIKSMYHDIKADIFDLQEVNTSLLNQIGVAKNIVPIMESKNRFIADSLKFIKILIIPQLISLIQQTPSN
jgi:hypothetical protein